MVKVTARLTVDICIVGLVELQENNFTGPVPTTIFTNPTVERVRISQNFFTGTIPTTIGLMAKLSDLRMRHNDLDGRLPTQLFQLPSITTIDVSHCSLEGTLSNEFALLNGTLRNLILNNNPFTGPVPQGFDELTRLSKSETTFLVSACYVAYRSMSSSVSVFGLLLEQTRFFCMEQN
mmetsp:Transcript_23701/g.55216  ORF Transcript_23701/g.55216 Transcript_23701/m.55216 type:complete len:178 (+) Transcript_23701:2473-3006(+)